MRASAPREVTQPPPFRLADSCCDRCYCIGVTVVMLWTFENGEPGQRNYCTIPCAKKEGWPFFMKRRRR
jgi:hypothetical protein